jgi:hypothetical protein
MEDGESKDIQGAEFVELISASVPGAFSKISLCVISLFDDLVRIKELAKCFSGTGGKI